MAVECSDVCITVARLCSKCGSCWCFILSQHCLVGPVVKMSVSRAADPWLDSHLCCGDFSGLSHTSDLEIGTPVATLLGTWHYRVSTWTGWPGVSTL